MRPTGNLAADSLISTFIALADLPIGDWVGSDKSFQAILTELAQIKRDSWSAYAIGLAYVKSSKRTPASDSARPDLFDSRESLLRRLQHARRQAGNVSWWLSQLSTCSSGEERQAWSLVAITVCGPVTLSKICPAVDEILSTASSDDFSRLVRSIEMARTWDRRKRGVVIESLPESMGARMAAILALFAPTAEHDRIVDTYLPNYRGEDKFVNEIIFYSTISRVQSDPSDWDVALKRLHRSYHVDAAPIYPGHFRGVAEMSLAAAKKVARDAGSYPHGLVRLAEVRLRRELGAHTVPLSRVAEDDGWFED